MTDFTELWDAVLKDNLKHPTAKVSFGMIDFRKATGVICLSIEDEILYRYPIDSFWSLLQYLRETTSFQIKSYHCPDWDVNDFLASRAKLEMRRNSLLESLEVVEQELSNLS